MGYVALVFYMLMLPIFYLHKLYKASKPSSFVEGKHIKGKDIKGKHAKSIKNELVYVESDELIRICI